ncbi:hypothetical protein [Membranihabitans maritimus]|uniref:hypothetical protein n=1 Tax=Membranihabitans maritimus TaxID=2904244 RepID=UPI001F18985E|nr:hypothetical protein [Membranihabitans maritimus]
MNVVFHFLCVPKENETKAPKGMPSAKGHPDFSREHFFLLVKNRLEKVKPTLVMVTEVILPKVPPHPRKTMLGSFIKRAFGTLGLT